MKSIKRLTTKPTKAITKIKEFLFTTTSLCVLCASQPTLLTLPAGGRQAGFDFFVVKIDFSDYLNGKQIMNSYSERITI